MNLCFRNKILLFQNHLSDSTKYQYYIGGLMIGKHLFIWQSKHYMMVHMMFSINEVHLLRYQVSSVLVYEMIAQGIYRTIFIIHLSVKINFIIAITVASSINS